MTIIELRFHSDESSEQKLCQAYWASDENGRFATPVAEVANGFGLSQGDVYRLVRHACTAVLVHSVCPSCESPTVVENRTHLARLLARDHPSTKCVACVQRERQLAEHQVVRSEERKRSLIEEIYVVRDAAAPDLATCSARTLVGLAALLRTDCLADGVFDALSEREGDLARGTPRASTELMSESVEAGLVRAHPSSPTTAFLWEGESELPERFYTARARYYLVGSGDLDARVRDLGRALDTYLPGLRNSEWATLTELWLETAGAECEAYLLFHLSDRGLSFSPGQKTSKVIRDGLKYLTLGQMFNLIWRSAAQADSYWHRNKISGKQAANSAITYLEAQIARVLSEDREIEPYRLDSRIGLASFSSALFYDAMGMRDALNEHPLLQVDRTARPLSWTNIGPGAFENLIFLLVQQADGYTNVAWLMHTNAPDHGRDISAYRSRTDPLSGLIRERVIFQCKHYTSGSVNDKEIADGLVSIEHWDDPTIDVFIVVTSGKFTADGVAFVERHNNRGKRPRVEMWNDGHLDVLLARQSGLREAFSL